MTTHFDELIQIWDKTTDEHIAWQKKAKTMPIEDLFSYVQKLIAEENKFDKKTEHMTDKNPGFHTSLLAAKFKNHYAINRFLASVLVELSFRLMKTMIETVKDGKQKRPDTSKKSVLTREMKTEITEQVKLEVLKLKRDLQKDSTRKKTSHYQE